MKFIIKTILILAAAFVLEMFIPFWSIVIAAFVIPFLMTEKPKRYFSKAQPTPRDFLAGFVSIFLLWGVTAYAINSGNDGLLAQKVANILRLGDSAFIVVVLTAILGGLVGGLCSLSGGLLGLALRTRGRS